MGNRNGLHFKKNIYLQKGGKSIQSMQVEDAHLQKPDPTTLMVFHGILQQLEIKGVSATYQL